jgi:hypothetical protein
LFVLHSYEETGGEDTDNKCKASNKNHRYPIFSTRCECNLQNLDPLYYEVEGQQVRDDLDHSRHYYFLSGVTLSYLDDLATNSAVSIVTRNLALPAMSHHCHIPPDRT